MAIPRALGLRVLRSDAPRRNAVAFSNTAAAFHQVIEVWTAEEYEAMHPAVRPGATLLPGVGLYVGLSVVSEAEADAVSDAYWESMRGRRAWRGD